MAELCRPCYKLFEHAHKIGYWEADSSGTGLANSKRDEAAEGPIEVESDWIVLDHHENFEEFSASATAGCHMCALFLSQQTREDRQHSKWSNHKGRASLYRYYEQNLNSLEIKVEYFFEASLGGGQLSTASMELSAWPTKETICPALDNPNRSWKNCEVDMISDCIRTCHNTHKQCSNDGQGVGGGPQRLIHVGDKADYSDLFIDEAFDPTERYLTLSHCWGPNGVPFKLLESNLKAFRTQIPWRDLTRTFQDAIDVARALKSSIGIKYLWIDALCIIQDDKTDRERELACMGGIYWRSFCNLASCLGRDSNAGLVQAFDPIRLHECVVRLGLPNQEEHFAKIGRFQNDAYKSLVTSSTLNTRAWVLQEVLLAPRVIYFTTQQLIWECCEDCFFQVTPKRSQSESPLTLKASQFSFRNPSTVNEYESGLFWDMVVENFTGRRLTFESDKTWAISALARLRLSATGDQYLVGLWRRNLHLSLVWYLADGFQSYDGNRPPLSNRPSWSWISTHGRVINFRMNEAGVRQSTCLAEFHPRIVFPAHGDLFGDPISPELDTIGVLLPVHLEASQPIGDGQAGNICKVVEPIFPSSKLQESVYQMRHRLDVLFVETEGQALRFKAHALVLYVHQRFRHSDKMLFGLLLMRVNGRRGTYRRIGVFNVGVSDTDILWKQARDSKSLENEEYIIGFENGTYKITLI